MITHYTRPKTLAEALQALQAPHTRPFGGGTILNRSSEEDFAVVDLQNLGLDPIQQQGQALSVGALASLETLRNHPRVPVALKDALQIEAPLNIRNQATLGGLIASGDGRSPALTALLALDAVLTLASLDAQGQPAFHEDPLGEWLPLRHDRPAGTIITAVRFSLKPSLAFQHLGRTPADRPLLTVALARWPSGRTRLVLGGWGALPTLAMDGPDGINAPVAAKNACLEADDARASADYRAEMAAVLAARCLETNPS